MVGLGWRVGYLLVPTEHNTEFNTHLFGVSLTGKESGSLCFGNLSVMSNTPESIFLFLSFMFEARELFGR